MSSEVDLRIWTADDYPTLKEWWEGHGWPAVPQRILPPLGVILGDLAAGFLYMDNGGVGVAMLEWLVTNPNAKPLAAARGLSLVISFLQSEAKRMEYPFLITTCKQESLARLLERSGFQRSDEGMIHLMGVFP